MSHPERMRADQRLPPALTLSNLLARQRSRGNSFQLFAVAFNDLLGGVFVVGCQEPIMIGNGFANKFRRRVECQRHIGNRDAPLFSVRVNEHPNCGHKVSEHDADCGVVVSLKLGEHCHPWGASYI